MGTDRILSKDALHAKVREERMEEERGRSVFVGVPFDYIH